MQPPTTITPKKARLETIEEKEEPPSAGTIRVSTNIDGGEAISGGKSLLAAGSSSRLVVACVQDLVRSWHVTHLIYETPD